MTTTTSPRPTVVSMSFSTCSGPKCLFTPLMTTSGAPGGVGHGGTIAPPPTVKFPRGRGTGIRARPRLRGPAIPCRAMTESSPPQRRGASVPAPYVRGPHVRLPDERARLRAAVRPAGGRGLRPGRRPARRRTWSCSTPARSGRTRTTGSTATSATCARSRTPRPGMQIAVGGCLAQKDRGEIVRRAPWVDAVFGTHNIGGAAGAAGAGPGRAGGQVEIAESLETFPSVLPSRRESAYSAWVSISVGCDNTCTFCIVPSLRGREKDRRPATCWPRSRRWSRRACWR